MESDHQIDLSTRKLTSRLIVQRALLRGWKITGFKTNQGLFIINIPGRKAPVQIFSASPPTMSLAASKIAKDKYITSQLLLSHDLPVPAEILVDTSRPLGQKQIDAFIKTHNSVVVKPIDSAHGRGISVGVKSFEAVKTAIQRAMEVSEDPQVIVQQQLGGLDVRIVCIGYKFVDTISRAPATVVGDGAKTITQLIDEANMSQNRGEKYKAILNHIPLELAQQFLGKKNMNLIPKKGELVQVIGVSNVGMGGERKNITDRIPSFMIEWAEKASKVMNLPVCGVDFMVPRLPQISDTKDDLSPVIIEVNNVPSLIHYEDINSPEQSSLIDRYLDYLSDIDKNSN